MKFKYKLKNKEGKIIEGYQDANDQFTLAHELNKDGSVALYIIEAKEGDKKSIFDMNFFQSISLSEKMIFTNNLSGMLSAGLALTRALQILTKQAGNKYMTTILESVIATVNGGETLSTGLNKFPKTFDSIFVAMVKAGEESGNLPHVLSEIGMTLKKSFDLNKKIKSAMMYPSIILGVILIIGVLMLMFVVPTLTKTFKDMGTKLPASTQFVITISDFAADHPFLLFGILIALFGGLYAFAKAEFTQKYFDFLILRLPVIGTIVKEVNTARTTRTLSSLLGSGLDMSQALSITSEVLQNIYYKKVVALGIENIQKGLPLSGAFKDNIKLYPVMVGEMMEVGEETGNLAAMLLNIATFYENEVDNKTKDLSTIIEPVLMVFIGGSVGFFAISMISPIYSVMDNVK